MNILIVDDEKSIRFSLVTSVKKIGYKVWEASDGVEALEVFNKEKIDVVFLDIKMPKMDGIQVLKQIKQLDKNCIVIMMTHLSEVKLAVQAMKLGAYDYFSKPFSVEEMITILQQIAVYYKGQESLQNCDTSAVNIIGTSEKIIRMKKSINKLGMVNYKTSVLIHGESGTGKELVAKLIHEKCANTKPFIAINCAAIPKTLQESELFGHERGAFSDAKDTRVGLMEQVKDGVLFLDEIGDMDLELQAKLLRVLQEKKFRRIGGNTELDFKAMVVAATNKNLTEAIKNKGFREDLYYRLNIIPIIVPPLRERKEDIEQLIEYFVDHYNKLFNDVETVISKELIECLRNYDWPGNIRELKNLIERLMILSEGNLLTTDELPYELVDQDKSIHTQLSSLELAEQEVVMTALATYSWNITKAASSLDISRLTLRRKIEKYGISK